ncbi:hypothetical protein PAEPH01_2539, partial [Pancytospora epiphaga]
MDGSIRVSLTRKVPATNEIYQIIDYNILEDGGNCNCYRTTSGKETEEYLYKIMEKYDTITDFIVYTDDLLGSLPILIFLRDQNPKITINLYWLHGKTNKICYTFEDVPTAISEVYPELEDVFSVADSVIT